MTNEEKMKRKIAFIENNRTVLKENILTKTDNNSNVAESLVTILNDDRDIVEISEYYKIIEATDLENNIIQNDFVSKLDILTLLKSFLLKFHDEENKKKIENIDSYIELEKEFVLKKAI